MVDLELLKSVAMAATPGPWQWWTSNSTLRLTGADGRDGGVLHAYSHRGYGDVSCSEANRAFIEAANPVAVLELIEENARLKAERATPPSPSTAPEHVCDSRTTNMPGTAPTVEVDERVAATILKSIIEDGYLSETNVGRYHAALASKPPAIEAAERQSIDTPAFQTRVGNWAGAAPSSDIWTRTTGAKQAWAALIAHIDTWAGAALAAGSTTQPSGSKQE